MKPILSLEFWDTCQFSRPTHLFWIQHQSTFQLCLSLFVGHWGWLAWGGQPEYRREGRMDLLPSPPSLHPPPSLRSVSKRSYNVPRFILLPPETNIFHIADVRPAVVLSVFDGPHQLPRMVLQASISICISCRRPIWSLSNGCTVTLWTVQNPKHCIAVCSLFLLHIICQRLTNSTVNLCCWQGIASDDIYDLHIWHIWPQNSIWHKYDPSSKFLVSKNDVSTFNDDLRSVLGQQCENLIYRQLDIWVGYVSPLTSCAMPLPEKSRQHIFRHFPQIQNNNIRRCLFHESLSSDFQGERPLYCWFRNELLLPSLLDEGVVGSPPQFWASKSFQTSKASEI